jgi:nucleoside-diphosphate-sugar epimerase
MKIAVIGPNGYIGRHLSRRLLADGSAVVPISSRDGSGIDPETGRLANRFRLESDIDCVVYLAQSPRVRDGHAAAVHMLNVNVVSATQVAAAACDARVRRFLYASTGNVYRPSFEPLQETSPRGGGDWYALSKVQAEDALNLFRDAIEVHVLRLFGVYGPEQEGRLVPKVVNAVLSGAPVTLHPNPYDTNDMDGLKISLTYIDDLIEILVQIANTGGPSVINVAGGDVRSIRDIACMVGSLIGRTPHFAVMDTPRSGNLIADNSLLVRTLAPHFTAFDLGMKRVLAQSAVSC